MPVLFFFFLSRQPSGAGAAQLGGISARLLCLSPCLLFYFSFQLLLLLMAQREKEWENKRER